MKRKLLISYISLLLVGTLITGVLSFSFIRNSYIKNKEEKLISNANLIIDSLMLEQELQAKRNYFWLVQNFAGQIEARVTFIDDKGQVLADSIDNSIMFVNQRNKPEFILAEKGEVRSVQRIDETTGKNSIYLTMAMIDIDGRKMIIRLSDDIEDILELNMTFLRYISISIMVGLVVAMGIGYWQIGSIIKPIKELKAASKLISKGDFKKRIKVKTNDELQDLGDSFNKMAMKLEKMISAIKDQNIKMDSMLTGMTDGVIALDLNKKILLINHESRELLNVEQDVVIGSPMDKAIQNNEMYEMIENTFIHKKSYEEEMKLMDENKRIVKVKSSLMKNKNDNDDVIGVFLLIQDVTEIRKLEALKSEFAANVSHELRTPLTLISGFVETLQSWESLDEKDRKMALNIIELETERLKRLINDILRLSEIENIQRLAKYEVLDIEGLINEVQYMMSGIAAKKNIQLKTHIEKNVHTLFGNSDWFKQMLVNLIENAIKYTPTGGQIKVSAKNEQNEISIMVMDNGIGIPKEDCERIFERFYRVDKARSRDVGGTGLGLTIVKHIVTEFGGTIEVSSKLNQGSHFKVRLPSK
ncbi:multi-sensor signal transduction histidine kinase [Alkaliphilus metalliredigens QYMF]|uniref:histidine kinase n=1 Tax=Alkaliphilus metalliredigens (strain QYMF) TaxID=293826 RepID=A6TSQ8_ALKMQ|nr:ATP-binding protein [Alkaliphilus metalliredigens]ABR49226.1 multi-sensor signal transduction histidine kinase [Alkaliphilus metalliredigens QYMF]